MYLAFNRSVVMEAKQSFPPGIMCKTIHALAYYYVSGGSKITIDDFTSRHVREKELEAEEKTFVVQIMEEFFNSSELSMSFFDQYSELGTIAKKYVNEMVEHKRNPTFGFLIKWFHLQLANGTYNIPKLDMLLLDEAGDTTGVSLEIFNLIPARIKLMVGDEDQNIYGFMYTINGFEHLKHVGKQFNMTQSFRVNKTIATKIQHFLNKYLNEDREFKGVDQVGTPKDIAYISRTNSAMISRMIELIEDETPFEVIRKPSDIFAIPLVLMNVHKPDYKIHNPSLDYLKHDYKVYTDPEKDYQKQFKTFGQYLEYKHPHDVQLNSAIKLMRSVKPSLNQYGTISRASTIYNAYSIAKSYYEDNVSHAVKLTTAFTSKGLEYDSVYIEDDINNIVNDIIDKFEDGGDLTDEDYTELRLAYVACSRSKYKLYNAKFLDRKDTDKN
jgi:superfamily I DNA/RNA helicase